jgi:uncharacterized membrane protein YuzA (DUF378 family)
MRSSNLLPALTAVPSGASRRQKSHREFVTDLLSGDPALHAAEAAAGASFALWAIFTEVNVNDRLFEAYEMAYPGLAADHSLNEHFLRVSETGESSLTGFISGLKGKLAEIHAKEILEQNGYTNVEIAENATQSVWDINATSPSGEREFFQVKTGAEGYAGEVSANMEVQPDVHFVVSSEIYQRVSDTSPEHIDRLTDIGYDYTSVSEITDELTQLSENMGLDISDGIGEAFPYLGTAISAARVTYSVVKVESEFKHLNRTTRNRVQFVQNVPLAVGICVVALLATLCGAVGTSVSPVIGTIIGIAAGVVFGLYLNQRLQPHVKRLAEKTVRISPDDLFYYKHKPRIDKAAMRFHETARRLAAPN